MWFLIIVMAFSEGSGYRHGGSGGLTSESAWLDTQAQCDSLGKTIVERYKARTLDKDRRWMANHLNIKYECIEVPKAKPKRKK